MAYLIGLVIDLFLADHDALCVGHDREEMEQAPVVEHCAAKRLAVDREAPGRAFALRLVNLAPVVLVARTPNRLLIVVAERRTPARLVSFGCERAPRHDLQDRLVDDRVEGLLVDLSQGALDRRLARHDKLSGCGPPAAVQASSCLVVEVPCPLCDLAGPLRAAEHRCGADEQHRGQLVADPLLLPVVFQLAQARVQPAFSVDDDGVQIDHVPPPRSGSDDRVVERCCEQGPSVLPERVHPGALLLSVVDPGAVAARVARGGADGHEVRGLVAGALVTGGVGEGLDQEHRVAVAALCVRAQAAKRAGEHEGGEVLPAVLVEHAEPLVVHDEAQPAELYLFGPADEALPGTEAQRGGAEANECDPLALFHRDVAKYPTGQAVAEEVVVIEQLVEARHLTGRDEPHDERVEAPSVSRALVHLPACSRQEG